MKKIVVALFALFSLSASACKVDIEMINKKVASMLTQNLEITLLEIQSQNLIHSEDHYPEVMTTSCPETTTFIHAFTTKRCSIITKYKMSYSRIEINPFSVLDIDCH